MRLVYMRDEALRPHTFSITQLIVTSAATQQREVSCTQSETSILVSDWLQLTGFCWVTTELTIIE